MMMYTNSSFIVGHFENEIAHGRCRVFDKEMNPLKTGFWDQNILIEELSLEIEPGIKRFEKSFINQIEEKLNKSRKAKIEL